MLESALVLFLARHVLCQTERGRDLGQGFVVCYAQPSFAEPQASTTSQPHNNLSCVCFTVADIPLNSFAELRRKYDNLIEMALKAQNLFDNIASVLERFQVRKVRGLGSESTTKAIDVWFINAGKAVTRSRGIQYNLPCRSCVFATPPRCKTMIECAYITNLNRHHSLGVLVGNTAPTFVKSKRPKTVQSLVVQQAGWWTGRQERSQESNSARTPESGHHVLPHMSSCLPECLRADRDTLHKSVICSLNCENFRSGTQTLNLLGQGPISYISCL